MAKNDAKDQFGAMTDGIDNPDVGNAEAERESGSRALMAYSNEAYFERDDVVMPRLRLAQGLSTEVQDGVAKPGQWLLQGFEPLDSITVVPLMFARQRELRDADSRDILCFSRDGAMGEGEPGGACADCPMNKWVDGDGDKRIPPACTFFYAYIVYVVEHDAVAALRFGRTGIKAGKLFNTAVANKALGQVAIRLTSTASRGPRGTFSSPTPNPVTVEPVVFDLARKALTR